MPQVKQTTGNADAAKDLNTGYNEKKPRSRKALLPLNQIKKEMLNLLLKDPFRNWRSVKPTSFLKSK